MAVAARTPSAAPSAGSTVLRVVLVVALLAAAAIYPLQYLLYSGTFGFGTAEYMANAPSVTRHLTAVAPGSAAAHAGIRPGDELPLRNVDRVSRVRLALVLPGQTGTYVVRRGQQSRRVTLVAGYIFPWQFDVVAFVRTLVIFGLWTFALLVIARAWRTEFGPLIALFLTCGVLDAACDGIPWTPWTANVLGEWFFGPSRIIDAFAGFVTQAVPVILAARIAGLRIPTVRIAMWTVIVISAAAALTGPFLVLERRHGDASYAIEGLTALCNWLPFLASALGMLVAYAYAAHHNGQRLRWLFWGCVPYLVGISVINMPFVLQSNWTHDTPLLIIRLLLLRALELALPISMIYGVLYRRVIDTGFVLNRVAIYGAVSVVLVAVFVLVEYAVSHLLLEIGRTGSILIQLAIALTIGFSVRYLHGIVEHVVDHFFFAKRHADEAALYRFAREAEVFSKSDTLLDRTIEVLSEHSEASNAAVYLNRDGASIAVRARGAFPERIDIDDELLVRLRALNEPVDTHSVKTVFPDGMVFPMSVRGRCIGALACAAKRDGSAFDPDERDALLAVAHGVAAGLEITDTQDALISIIQSGFEGLHRDIKALARDA